MQESDGQAEGDESDHREVCVQWVSGAPAFAQRNLDLDIVTTVEQMAGDRPPSVSPSECRTFVPIRVWTEVTFFLFFTSY